MGQKCSLKVSISNRGPFRPGKKAERAVRPEAEDSIVGGMESFSLICKPFLRPLPGSRRRSRTPSGRGGLIAPTMPPEITLLTHDPWVTPT